MAAAQANGQGTTSASGGAASLSEIHRALEVVHNPHSANQSRREAQIYLEEVKSFGEAPLRGYELASDRSQSPVVRHYALSLLEYAIRHKWADYTEEQAVALRHWVLGLCQGIDSADPAYLRAKAAQLWVEVSKRSWAAGWNNMDELLVQLWQVPDSAIHKELVLAILEALAEDVFGGDDPVVAMRETDLSKACVEIFTPTDALAVAFPTRQGMASLRCGDEGWLARVSRLLGQCIASDLNIGNQEARSVALRALSVLTSTIAWILPMALASTGCVGVLTSALALPQVSIQKAAVDALHILYSRTNLTDPEALQLVCPMFRTETVDLFRRLAKWATVDAEDIDDDKYQFSKKLSEMLSCLGIYLDRKFHLLERSEADIGGFLDVTTEILRSESLIVSIPVLVSWNRLLAGNLTQLYPGHARFIEPLLEVCSSRLIRYEHLPDDTRDPTFLFLMEDTDTVPERHVFLGNYRRYCTAIIQTIVHIEPTGALSHVLSRAGDVLASVSDGRFVPNKLQYSKYSLPVLRVDAQLTVVESSFKGYMRWRRNNPHLEEQRISIEQSLENWCGKLFGNAYEDPQIRKRILQLLVFFSTTALDNNAPFMLKVLEHILMTWPALEPGYRDYSEAIKELQSDSTVELQRLALEMPDHLLVVYDQLESRVHEMIQTGTLDEKRAVAYKSFLFLIIHRAQTLDSTTKVQKLQGFVTPALAEWQTDDVKRALETFPAFSSFLGLDQAQAYLSTRCLHLISDWGSYELDREGLALQDELERRLKLLPLRATKSLLMNSVERLDRSSQSFQVSQALWEESLPQVLSDVLRVISNAHSCHNPENWDHIPSEFRHNLVGRILSDRFWQAGISGGSKDEFYARVMDKKATAEGLASTIRGSIRFVRETSYALLCCVSRFDVMFYGLSELPTPLSHAVFANSSHLSSHQHVNLLQLVKYLTDDVPPELREGFLPSILGGCFRHMDDKITAEWSKLDRQQTVAADGEALQEEMKAESILRQATNTAVLMVAEFLDPNKKNPGPLSGRRGRLPPSLANDTRVYPSLRRFCLLQSMIVEPLMLFSTHAITIRDQRSCSIILRVFRSIVPEFAPPTKTAMVTQEEGEGAAARPDGEAWPIPAETASAIREYLSSSVLRACITAFHEPYFVELQKELASLIAQILVYYGRSTDTGRKLLLSLPNIKEQDVDRLVEYMDRPSSGPKQQRAVVLDLLKDLKGVSVSEMGKLPASLGLGTNGHPKRADRSKMAQQFMTEQLSQPTGGGGGRGNVGASRDTPDALDGLEGMADLFNP